MSQTIKVSEIFYSLQGEGARTGTPTVFIRLQGCKAKNACYTSGVRCDTEFESGSAYTLEELLLKVEQVAKGCKEITWTGGEPTDQLTKDMIQFFKQHGYYQAIETSGLNPVPDGIDFICVSPKVAEHVIAKNFPNGVNELRYVRHQGQTIPSPAIEAEHYWISPHSDGFTINGTNLQHCIQLCLNNPKWKMSVQNHKLWNIL
jgi:organic radical activating enzyme